MQAHVWTMLGRGVRDRRAAARHPVLATVSPDGRPQARTVVLRGLDLASALIDIHTDLRSAKVADLRANPQAALHVWDSGAHLQIRLDTHATILSGAEVARDWARVPEGSRSAYGARPAPGQPVAHALGYEARPDAGCFAVLRLQVEAMDILHLGADHRRAHFVRADDWAGQWVSP